VSFAEKHDPVGRTTLLRRERMGRDAPAQGLGWVGMHGWKHVNRAIQSADLLIALGMRFDDRVTRPRADGSRRTARSSTWTSTRPRSQERSRV